MSTLNFDPVSGELTTPGVLVIMAGYDHPFTVILASAADLQDLQLAIITAGSTPVPLAYTEAFEEVENELKFSATLDCNDTRLTSYLLAGNPAALQIQFAALVDGERRSRKLPISVEVGGLGGSPSSQGGPVYDTVAQRNTAISAAVSAALATVPAQPAAASQIEMETGTEPAARILSPLRVRQSILTAPIAATQLTGTIDIARLPAMPSTNTVVPGGGTIASLTTDEQALISTGTLVLVGDGRTFRYKGSGSKTLEASYLSIADLTPDWSIIANKPTISSFILTLLDDADAAAARDTLGLVIGGTVLAPNGDGSGLSGVPGTFTVGTGWALNGDDGEIGTSIPAAVTIDGVLTDEAIPPFTKQLIQDISAKLKALCASVRDHVSPDV